MMICITVFHPIITCRQTIKRSYYMPTQHCLFVAAVTVIIMLALSQMCKSHSPSTRKSEIQAMAMGRGIFCSGLFTFLRVVMAELRPLKQPTINRPTKNKILLGKLTTIVLCRASEASCKKFGNCG